MNAFEENLRLQAEEHPLDFEHIATIEEQINYLVHLKAYEEMRELCRDQSTLDWGCNTGFGMQVLLRNGARPSGLDLSTRSVEAARQRLTSSQVEQFDGRRAPFADASFDVVVSFQVVEHIVDYDAYFSEIRRVLRPGGRAVFTTPNAVLRVDPGAKPWNPFHVREFTAAELRALLSKWFGEIQVRGLFAVDEVYWIERRRVERQKIASRHPPPRVSPLQRLNLLARSTVKRLLPVAVLHAIRPPPPPPDLARFKVEQLFYRDDRLDDSLDLMAICR
jgi:SAM-dependent methyltransferase